MPHSREEGRLRPAEQNAGGPVAFRLTLPVESEDLVTALLWGHGTMGIEVQSAETGPALLLAYFPPRAGLEEDLRRALSAIRDVHAEPVPIPDVDWVARVREGFRPFRVPGFQVLPAWESSAAAEGPVIRIDPGRAFGTGTHESTQLCLAALEERRERGALGRVLDLGTGTGILAVAAALSGASRVVGVDHDPDAIDSAREHCRLNGVDVALIRGDLGAALAPGCFNVVLANLTAGLLLDRRHEISALRSPQGILVLSGFLLADLPVIEDAYRAAGTLSRRAQGEWVALLAGPLGQ